MEISCGGQSAHIAPGNDLRGKLRDFFDHCGSPMPEDGIVDKMVHETGRVANLMFRMGIDPVEPLKEVFRENDAIGQSDDQLRDDYRLALENRINEALPLANVSAIDFDRFFEASMDASQPVSLRLSDGKTALLWRGAATDIPNIVAEAFAGENNDLAEKTEHDLLLSAAFNKREKTELENGLKIESAPVVCESKAMPLDSMRSGWLKKHISAACMAATIATSLFLAPASSFADAPAPSLSSSKKIMHTVSFRKKPDNLAKERMDSLMQGAEDPLFTDKGNWGRGLTWNKIEQMAEKKKTTAEKLDFVNSLWNRIGYVDDMTNYGKEDYWAKPSQFMERGGDCEDYAIAKYLTLKKLGMDPDDMRILIVKLKQTGEAHAVLHVFDGQNGYVLDNLQKKPIKTDNAEKLYVLYSSINEKTVLAHVKGKPVKPVKAVAANDKSAPAGGPGQ